MLYSTVAQVGLVALLAVTLLAAAVGDRLVRLSAFLHAVNWVLVAVLQRRHQHHVFQTGDFLTDIAGAVAACFIAAVAGRSWAAALAAFQLLGVFNYLLPLLDRTILHHASVTTSYIWEAGALVSLAVGALQSRARVPARMPSVPFLRQSDSASDRA